MTPTPESLLPADQPDAPVGGSASSRASAVPAMPVAAPRRRRGQRGVALLVVLGIVGLLTVLVAMMGVASQVARVGGRVHAARADGRYQAESGLAYATWMMMSQRASSAGTGAQLVLGQVDLTLEGADDILAWTADGSLRQLDLGEGLQCRYRISDGFSGWDLGHPAAIALARTQILGTGSADTAGTATMDAAHTELAERFFSSLQDYVDSDDLHREHGMERDGYEDLDPGLAGLPRNAPLRMRDELYWIPGIEAMLPSRGSTSAALRSPSGTESLPPDLFQVVLPSRTWRGKQLPSFFASSPAMIQLLAELNDDELAMTLDARRAWYETRQPIREGLGDLYPRLAEALSFTESGIYQIEVEVLVDGMYYRRCSGTLDLRRRGRNLQDPWLTWLEYRTD